MSMNKQNHFDPDIIHDAKFACKDMGETAAEMISFQFSSDELAQFKRIYTKALDQLINKGLWSIRPNNECPQPDIFISEGLISNKKMIDLLGKVQETVDAYFDEDLFIDLADGDPEGPYTNTHYPFSPYNRFYFEFYCALQSIV